MAKGSGCLLFLCGLLWSLAAEGASFDCDKARSQVEKTICSDAELSKLDDDLGIAYQASIAGGGAADQSRQEQRRWLAQRNACRDRACIKSAYEARLGDLRAAASASPPTLVFERFTERKTGVFTSPVAQELFDFFRQKTLVDAKDMGPIELKVLERDYFRYIKEYGSYTSLKGGEFLVQGHVISIVRYSSGTTTIKGQQLEAAYSLSSGLAACGAGSVGEAEHIYKHSFKDINNDGIEDVIFDVAVRDCSAKSGHRAPIGKRVAWVWDGTAWARSVLK